MINLILILIIINSSKAIAEHVYTFVGQESYAPFNYVDAKGKLVGIDVEIIQKAAETAGVKVNIKTYPWARAVLMAQNGTVDGVFGFGKKPDREIYFYYPETPLRNVRFAFFVNENFDGVIEEHKDIGNQLIGVVRNYFISSEFNGNHTIRKFYANTPEQLLLQVSKNRYQIAIYSQIAGTYEMKRLGINNLRIYPYNDAPVYPTYLAFSKASPQGEEAYKKFSQVLKQLKKNGVIDEIHQKHSQ